jgi:sulfur-carrier protein
MIRVILPQHLRTLAKSGREVQLEVEGPVTQQTVLDALEAAYPPLRGAVRDPVTGRRRDLMRFFALGKDYTLLEPDDPLPEPVAMGAEPLHIVGAIAGG